MGRKLCGGFGLLAVRMYLHRSRYAGVGADGESGNCSGRGVCIPFLGYMMNSITGLIGDHLITKVLGAYDLYTPLQSFMSGCLDLTGVVYFVSVTALCLF